jgi:Carboxypeptidase regulatory-like domain
MIGTFLVCNFESFQRNCQMKIFMKRRALFSMLFILLLSFTGESWAQFAQRGGIAGSIEDPTGAVVPGAKITLVQLGQNQTRQVTGDAQGHYEFNNLVAGQYLLTATADGFSRVKSEAVAANIGAITTYNFKLQAGSVNETVTVSAEGGGLQTDQVALNSNFSTRQMEDLPLNGQNFTSVEALVPGITTYPAANVNTGGTYSVGAQFAVGGIASTAGGAFEGSRDTGYYINGVNVNDNYESSTSFVPALEALGTGTATVTDYSAAVGRDFANLSMQTKGGANKLHGEAYDFLENTDLDATNPYNKLEQSITGTPATRQILIRNQFGGNLGGPIYIPKVLPRSFKDKFFFFANYQKVLESDGNSLFTASVPSAAERTGDYSELLVNNSAPQQLYNPFSTTYDANGNSTRPAIPNNRLDLATKPDGSPLIDPNAVALINATVPLPNVSVPSNETNYVGYQAESISGYHVDTRFDARITQNDSVFVTWSESKGSNQFSGGPQPYQLYTYPTEDQSYLVTVNYAHIFTPKLTNEFIFGAGEGSLLYTNSSSLNYLNSSSNPINQYLQNTGTGEERGAFSLQIDNYVTPGNGYIFRDQNESLQFSDNLTWVHDKHTLTAGFSYMRKIELDWAFEQAAEFSGAFSRSGSSQGYVGGDGSADALMGLPTNISSQTKVQSAPPTAPGTEVAFPYYGLHVNDLFRINPKLTISAGLRYDLSIPPYSPDIKSNPCCLVYQPNSSGGVLAYPGIASGVPLHSVSAAKTDFAPRLSIIYSPDQKTAIRAGYGMFYVTGASYISSMLLPATGSGNGGLLNVYTVNNSTLGAPPTLR